MKKVVLLLVAIMAFGCSNQRTSDQAVAVVVKKNLADTVKYRFKSEIYPGIQPGEVFLCLISKVFYYDKKTELFTPDENRARAINFDAIGYKTKRCGQTAYDIYGNINEDMCPVFVQKSEIINWEKITDL